MLENDMFIICACMPAMRSILRKLAPSYFGSSHSGGYSGAKVAQDFGPNAQYHRTPSKNGYSSHRSASSKTGIITKAIDVESYRTERSESDVELVKQVPGKIYGA